MDFKSLKELKAVFPTELSKLAEALTENGHPSCVSSYPNPAILTSAPWDIIYNLALEVSTAT